MSAADHLYRPTPAAEIAAIRRLPWRNIYGEPICQAFGISYIDTTPGECREWNFEIQFDRASVTLQLCCDVYLQMIGAGMIGGGFNEDDWEDAKLYITAPATRANYRQLARVGRRMLNGPLPPLGCDGMPIRGSFTLKEWGDE